MISYVTAVTGFCNDEISRYSSSHNYIYIYIYIYKRQVWRLKNSKISDLIWGAVLSQVSQFSTSSINTKQFEVASPYPVIYNDLGSILTLKVKAPNAKSETNDLLCLSEHSEE